MSQTSSEVDTLPAAPTPKPERADARQASLRLLSWGVPILVIAVIVVLALTTRGFLTADNIKAVFRSAAYTGIVAVAMTPMTVSGNFVSLATQQTAVAGGMFLVLLLNTGFPVILAVIVLVAAVVATGVVQALLVAAGLNPIITTLAAASIFLGATNTFSGSKPVALAGPVLGWGNSSVIGIPIEVLVFGVFTVVVNIGFTRTTLGRATVLTGSNRRTAAISGLSFRRVTLAAFAVFSLGIAVVAVLYPAGYRSVTPDTLNTLTFDVIGALLVGGVAITGGRGTPWRSAVGAVFIATTTNVLLLHGLPPGKVALFTGAIITAAVVLLVFVERRRSLA
ncbi:ABC transporter permease [Amycolatopsis pithecellobii]|uniref:ABC transporter permease n=1 Tax=Amycolatopsis pithecellobii TaxID=664692 RepID=A0A6N7ZBJ8_9PSEU|nr:ABC transporter permease [Amycolatopsis pithecellobii]MTD59113.1 ABC transporter permease [Amycolatopsis pithecellobii]